MKRLNLIMIQFTLIVSIFFYVSHVNAEDTHAVALTLQDQYGSPIRGVPCSVFSDLGMAQGISGYTGKSGQVAFNLSAGSYKFKIECWDAEFWTDVVDVSSDTGLVQTLARPQLSPSLGVNLNPVGYYRQQIVFVDRFKAAGTVPTAIPTDEQGYPLELPYNGQTVTAYMFQPCPQGLYTVYYEGEGTFEAQPANLIQIITTEPGRTQFYFTPTASSKSFNMVLKTSQIGNHLRNIRVIMPGHEETYEEEPFYPPFIERLSPFNVLHFYNMATVKDNPNAAWADRTMPDDYTQGKSQGAAFEYMIELANKTGKDPWFTIPANVTNEYIHNLAALIYDNLDPELKVYLNYDSLSNVARCVQVFSIFEEVFGGDERLVKILLAAQGQTNYRMNQFLDPANNPNGITLNAIGMSFRYGGVHIASQIVAEGLTDTITVDQILDRIEARLFNTELATIQEGRSVADTHGLSLYIFDTGDYFTNNGSLSSKFIEANRNPRIKEIFSSLLDLCFNNGVDMMSFFSNVESNAYGLLEYQDQPVDEALKYQAVLSYMKKKSISVEVSTTDGSPIPNLEIQAYTGDDLYTGIHHLSGNNGIADFNDLETGIYKFRTLFQSHAVWSETVNPDINEKIHITIETEPMDVSIITSSGPVEGVIVQVFAEDGNSINMSGFTGTNGKVSFDLLSGGRFKFLAVISGQKYWSDLTTIDSGNTNGISILASNQWSPAEIVVNTAVAASSPTRFGANFSSDRQLNEYVINGSFEPQVDRYMYIATGGTETYANGPFDRWDTITDGYYDGATLRAYRILNGVVTLVRKEIIPEGGYVARDWMSVVGGDIGNGMVPAFQKNEFTDGRRCHYYQRIDLENGQDYYYIVKAVDLSGNMSEASDECHAVPVASADNGPKIITIGFTNFVENESAPGTYNIYNDSVEATGGATPLTWTVEPGSSLPGGLSLNAGTGQITGIPISNAEKEFVLRVTDSQNHWDSRTFRMNSPEGEPGGNDSTPPDAPDNVQAVANKGSVTITWDPNTEADIAGYIVYRSKYPRSEHQQRIYFASSGPAVQEGDFLYIDLIRNDPPFDSVADRVLWNRFNGVGWGLKIDNNDWRSWSDPVSKWTRVSFNRIPHPGVLPSDFTNHGQTCLMLGTQQSEKIGIQQYRFGYPGSYYPPLKRNHTYRLSMWMRQEGISAAGIRFRMTGDYSYIDHTFSGVSGEWRRYDWDFTTSAEYPKNFVIDYLIEFNGPGNLWLDNVSIHDPALPRYGVLPEVVQSFADYHPGSLRIWSGQTNTVNGSTLENWTNPDDIHMANADEFSLPTALQFCMDTGATPWLIVGPYMDEEEWKGLIDYLAGDGSTEYGAKRIAQRGGNETPWTDEFEKIIIELGNETWNGLFEPWTYNKFGNGTLYGQFGEYWFNQAKASPSWHGGLESKIKFALGNWTGQNNGTLNNRGTQAMTASPSANLLVETLYNGGWEVGYIAGGNQFNDKGIQDILMFGPRVNHILTDKEVKSRTLAAEAGVHYNLGVYESGPSYDHQDPNNPVTNAYSRSLASGVATLDSHLYNSYYGFNDQCFFMFRTGGYTWSSHNLSEYGRQEQTAWQALKMRNIHADGDMLVTAALSEPTGSFPQEGAYAGVSDAPMIKTYAFRDGNKYAIFILSRKLDNFPMAGDRGDTPVTLRLPFTNASNITLYKLTGDPRANNLGGVDEVGNPLPQVIVEQQETIPLSAFSQRFVVDQATGGVAGGMPPGSIYLYVFEGTETPVLPPNPRTFINQISSLSTSGPGDEVRFRVIFDRPVTGFGDSAGDVILGGASVPSVADIKELSGYQGTAYDVMVSSMESTGTMSISIPAGAAEAVSNGAPNDPSISTGNIIVTAKTSQGVPHAGMTVSAFTLSGEFTGIRAVTTFDGRAYFPVDQFAPGEYRFKINCLGYEYWSDAVTISPGLICDVIINTERLEGSIILPGGPRAGVKVYLYPEDGTEIGISTETDDTGNFSFNAPIGQNYKVMTVVLGNRYWSNVVTISSGSSNAITVNTGGGLLQVALKDETGSPLAGTPLILCNSDGATLGESDATDASGIGGFYVTEGIYRVKADYLTYDFISPAVQVAVDKSVDFAIPHQSVEITMQSVFQGAIEPIAGVMVRLYSESGVDSHRSGQTDGNGKVVFRLPEKSFRAKADYLRTAVDSEAFTWQDKTVTLQMGKAEISASWDETPLQGAGIDLFSADGSDLDFHKVTDSEGKAYYRLPAGNYKFRLTDNNKQFWSDVVTLLPDQSAQVTISTGTRFVLTLQDESGKPVRGVPCMVYNALTEPQGISGYTGKSGQVAFNLSAGSYKFKIECWDAEFWTDVVDVSSDTGLVQTLARPQLSPSLGVNLNPVGYYRQQIVFVDRFKAAGTVPTAIPTDEQGYPLELPYNGQTVTAYMFQPCPQGLYTVYYEGEGTFEAQPANLIQIITTEPGRTQFYFTPTASSKSFNMVLKTSQIGNHLRNIRVIMPGHEETYEEEPFYPPFIERLSPFNVLHFYNMATVKDNPNAAWADRTMPDDYTQGKSQGAAFEYMIELANKTGKDPWFTIPANVTNEYIHNLAALIYDNLDPELKVYLNYDSLSNVARCVQVFSIFEEVFGGDERLVKILLAAQGQTNYRMNQFLDPANNPNGITLNAIGMSFRYGGVHIASQIVAEGLTDTITVDQILDRIEARLFNTELATIQEGRSVADTHGLSLYIFDTGDYFTNNGSLSSKFIEANRNPRIKEIFSSLLDLCFNNGVDMMSFFSNVESNAYGLLEYQDQPVDEAPKYQAAYDYVADMNTSPEIAVTSLQIPAFTNSDSMAITWEDSDPDNDANVSLYYDTDNMGRDGTLIVSGIKEDLDGPDDIYTWDLSDMDEGAYYIYFVINDPFHSAYAYSPAPISIDRTAPAVSSSPGAGSYDTMQTVSLIATEDSDIFYSLDGTEPGTDSLFYSGPITITENTTLKYMAVDLAGNQSAVASTIYDIGPQDVTVQVVTDTGKAFSEVSVYVFTASGSYTGKTAKTNADGKAVFSPSLFSNGYYKFRIDYLSNQFWSNVVTLPKTTRNQVIIPVETARITVTIPGGPVASVKVYLFSESGSYLGQYQSTDSAGAVSFELPEGIQYKFRADVLGSQYWTGPTSILGGNLNEIDLTTGGGLFRLTLQKEPGEPIQGMKLYLFGSADSYLGVYQVSDASGNAAFNVPEGTYKVRADYLGYQFWTDATAVTTDTKVDFTLPHTDAAITVKAIYQSNAVAMIGIKAYLFSASGTYLGSSLTTDTYGQVFFSLPDKAYKVRADYLGRQYWSEEFTNRDVSIQIPMADALVSVTGSGLPQKEVKVYLFSTSGTYLGLSQTTDGIGQASFRIPEGNYKFRADYQGKQFWSADSQLAADMINPVAVPVGGGSFVLSVYRENNSPLTGINCYVFGENGNYLGMTGATNTSGKVFFNLSSGAYKFRLDYLGEKFWSNLVSVPANLSAGMVLRHETTKVTVATRNSPVEGAKVYLFSKSGSYLGKYLVTDKTGAASFDLAVGVSFKFRADFLGSQYWSAETVIFSGVTNSVAINAGGGSFQITLLKGPGAPLQGVKLYLFNTSGSYLGLTQTTDASGHVSFEVPSAPYKVRADYLGYQFWSEPTEVSTNTLISFTIPHQNVEATINSAYQGEVKPLSAIKAYLFNLDNSYLSQYRITDSDGKVVFSLPERSYMLRVDYLGAQFWTDTFSRENIDYYIPHGAVSVNVRQSGANVSTAKVYLFTESGTYLGWHETTGTTGTVVFQIPSAHSYRFRVDHTGQQVWSPIITPSDGETVTIAIELSE